MAQQNGVSFGRPQTTAGGTQQWQPLPGFGAPRAEYANADEFLTELGQDAIRLAYIAGIGITVSKTSDGGALSLKVYGGDARYQAYAANVDEAESLWEAVGALARSKMPTPTAQQLETLVPASQAKSKVRNRPAQKLPAARSRK
jgi:hypothetical protein